jgi:hypothetical protein
MTILPAQETKLQNPSPKRPRRCAPSRAPRWLGATVRRLASLTLLTLALLAAPVPQAVAQAPQPTPEELWRQFPLNSAPSTQQAPAEPRSAPAVSPPTRSDGNDGGAGSLETAEIAAIVLTLALVLTLTTAMLAYATQDRMRLGIAELRRRGRGFWQPRDASRAVRTGRREDEVEKRPRRRSTGAAAVRLRELRATVSKLRERTVLADSKRTANEVAARPQTPGSDFAPAEHTVADEELERLKAKLDVHPAPTRSAGDDELEILKTKRARPAAVDVEHPNEVETLKAKLAAGAAADTRSVAKGKSIERGAPPNTSSKGAAAVDSLKAKLDLTDEAPNEKAPVSVSASSPNPDDRSMRRKRWQ